MSSSALASLSYELSGGAENVGASVVTVHGRHRVPSSGVYWRENTVVTADHTLRRDGDIPLTLPSGKRIAAKLAGRDPSTDLAVLKLEGTEGLAVPKYADAASIKLANVVLALGRTRSGNLVASAGIIGGLSGEWRTWRGGRIDRSIRLDVAFYPGFSGGPLVNAEGKVVGMNTGGLAHGRPVTVPASTISPIVEELLKKGHVARPYLGAALQPVNLPDDLRDKLKSGPPAGLLVVHIEAGGPANKAGVVLGDIIVELEGKIVVDTEQVRDLLSSHKSGDTIALTMLRGGSPLKLSVTLAERSA